MQHVYGGVVTTQLFNVNNDPMELANLVKDPACACKLEELKKLMDDYRDSWKDEKHPLGERYWTQYREIAG